MSACLLIRTTTYWEPNGPGGLLFSPLSLHTSLKVGTVHLFFTLKDDMPQSAQIGKGGVDRWVMLISSKGIIFCCATQTIYINQRLKKLYAFFSIPWGFHIGAQYFSCYEEAAGETGDLLCNLSLFLLDLCGFTCRFKSENNILNLLKYFTILLRRNITKLNSVLHDAQIPI